MAAEAPKPESEAPATPAGPRHGWLGIVAGLTGSLAMLLVTVWVLAQYLKHRPLDLIGPTHSVAEIAQGVLKNLGASPELIEVAGPQLESSPRAHFYRTSITAHLPGSTNPDYAVDAIERAMLRNRIVISSEEKSDTERIAYLSFEGNEVADIRLVHAPSRPALPHVEASDSHGAHHEPLHAPGDHHNPPVTEEESVPAPAESEHHSAASEGSTHSQGLMIPLGLYAPSFGEIAARGRSQVAQAHPRVAIIVDDGGYGGDATEIILGLDPGLTFAILPNTPNGTALAEEAAHRGFEIMLHMPMDNDSDTLRHPGQISTGMDAAEIHALTQAALAQVPGAVGINNHTGSKFTADAEAMRRFMQGIAGSGLYFIDSRTTPNTVAGEVAREFRVPAAVRTLFLDHDNEEAQIRARFDELIQEARAQGSAIGICHFRPNTATVLRDMLPQLTSAGIQLVHASELVR